MRVRESLNGQFKSKSPPFQGGVGLPALLSRAKRAGVVADDCDAIDDDQKQRS